MEALWKSILDILTPLVIPDWGALISLLPVFVAILVVAWFALTIRRFATAGPTRRAPARVDPIAPPTLHMPGPSIAPLLAAFGTFALFFGLVFRPALPFGVVILIVTLAIWGREALRDYEHLEPSPLPPVVVHPGPPPGVHMPGPSIRPLLGALGSAALLGGLVIRGWVLVLAVVFLAWTLVGWLVDATAEYRMTERADQTGHLENIPPRKWPGRTLQAFAVLFVLVGMLQLGVFPPPSGTTAGGPGASPGASGAPAGSGAPGGPAESLPPGTFLVVAKDVAFDTHDLTVDAGKPFAIDFRNEDPAGLPHDVDIRAADTTTVVQDQPYTDGGKESLYQYTPLQPGTYVFICSVHPIPAMTGTLTVK
ncbi:MAG TPA: cupredoxin domain-containing protein [Candidatus Eisenbacteria bacterium]|nr:cupredoxin domain-containing protein [Candidatus Eisenbacteria bacterium]